MKHEHSFRSKMSDYLVNCMKNGDKRSIKDFAEHLDNINDYIYNDHENELNLLHLAVGLDADTREDIVELIFELEADANFPAKSEGVHNIRPIQLAAMWGYDITLKQLLLNGADASLQDSKGWSAIDYASAFDNYLCISLLLRYGGINSDPEKWASILDSSMNTSLNLSRDNTSFVVSSPSESYQSFMSDIHEIVNISDTNSNDENNNNHLRQSCDDSDAAENSWDRIDSTVLNYQVDDEELRRELVRFGYKPGPIMESTRKIYIKLLHLLKRRNSDSYQPTSQKSNLNQKCLIEYSNELNSIVTGKFAIGQAIELEKEFIMLSTAEGGHGPKEFFNYILIDPRITQNLPEQALDASDSDTSLQRSSPNDPRVVMRKVNRNFNPKLFVKFINSIFYIGKGQKRRDLMHLFDAERDSILKEKSEKIRQIWREGYGVVSLHLFHNITSKEALTREALMIETIGLKNLTNLLSGSLQIKLCWNDHRRKLFGALLLHKAYNQLLNDGERQIKREDLRF